MISSGAIAMIGRVCEATSSGVSARRSHGEKSTAIASAQPSASDTANPTAVTCSVGTVLAQICSRAAQPCSSDAQRARAAPAGGTPDAVDVPLPGDQPDRDQDERRQAGGERPAARPARREPGAAVAGCRVARLRSDEQALAPVAAAGAGVAVVRSRAVRGSVTARPGSRW